MEGFEQSPGSNEPQEEFLLRLSKYSRESRGRLMARYYGTTETGRIVSGTTTLPLYREMADQYAQVAVGRDLLRPDAVATFIHDVTERIVGRSGSSAGNIHAENIERKIGMLVPSLLNAVELFPDIDVRTEPRPIPFIRRVELEIGEQLIQSTGNSVALGEPMNPVWVPSDDPELMERLVEAQHQREAAHFMALRRRVQISSVAPAPPSPSGTGHAPQDLRWFARSVT